MQQTKIQQGKNSTAFQAKLRLTFLIISFILWIAIFVIPYQLVVKFSFTSLILILNYPILIKGIKYLFQCKFTKPECIITFCALAVYIYETIAFCLIVTGNVFTNPLYFETITTIIVFTALGNFLTQNSHSDIYTKLQQNTTKLQFVFTLITLTISLLTFTIWCFFYHVLTALNFTIGILLLACPCTYALINNIPINIITAKLQANGITLHNYSILENLPKVNLVLFDKSSFANKIKVTNIQPLQGNLSPKNLLQFFASIERFNEHPIAKAITATYNNPNAYLEINNLQQFPEQCIQATLGNRPIYIGNAKFVAPYLHKADRDKAEALTTHYATEGKITLICATTDKLLGVIALTEIVDHQQTDLIKQLKQLGIRTALITEDHHVNTTAYQEIGIDKVISNVTATDKHQYVEALKKAGYRVLLVSANSHDTPAFQVADYSAFIKNSQTQIANTDITMSNISLSNILSLIKLNQKFQSNVKRSFLFTYLYQIISIPLATGILSAFIPLVFNPFIIAIAIMLGFTSTLINTLSFKL